MPSALRMLPLQRFEVALQTMRAPFHTTAEESTCSVQEQGP